MGKISTYANAAPVTLSDKFIGTEVAGTPVNVTKNFLVSDLLLLFQSNITLQNVLDSGNTATQSIILTGDITQTGNLTQSGGALTLGGTVKDFNGSLGNNGETLVCNASGQLVFGSGLTNQNLSQVLAIGNTATNNIILTGNITQTGDKDITGNVDHDGDYLFRVGTFELETNASLLIQSTVKDSTNTLGGDGQFLVSNASGKLTWKSTLPSPVASSALTTINLGLANSEGVLVTTAATTTDIRIPTNAGVAFPTGTKITIIQEGVGQAIIVGTAGVTVNSAVGLKTNAQFAVAHVVKTATDTWYAYGNLTP
jgi:hypothetical protein